MKKIFFFTLLLLLTSYKNISYSNFNTISSNGNQENYCETLSESNATEYDFYKCSYYEKIREKNKIYIPSQEELEKKRLEKYKKIDDERNEKIEKDSMQEIESKWQSQMNKNIAQYYNGVKANKLLEEGIALVKKSLCTKTEECINAVYLYNESLSLNYRKDVYDSLDALYLLIAAQYNKIEKYDDAIKYALLSKNKDLVDNVLATSYQSIALNYEIKGDYEKAIEYALLSIEKYGDVRNKATWVNYSIIGESFFEKKEYSQAIYYFYKVLDFQEDEDVLKNTYEYIKYSEQEIEKESIKINSIPKNNCGIKSINDSNGDCICEDGYIWEFPEDSNNLDCKRNKEIIIKEPKNDEQCKEKNGINSYFYTKGYCLCKDGYEFSEKSGYTVCEEKESLILRKKIDNKTIEKIDIRLKSILLQSDDKLIELRNKIDLLLNKKLNQNIKDILLYIKLIINDKLFESIKIEDLFY